VQAESAYGPDWRDAAAYAPLLDADRSLFAWEWLRRDPSYREAAQETCSPHGSTTIRPERFGLVAFEPPDAGVPQARPVWRSEVHPLVLSVELGQSASSVADKIDVQQMHGIFRMIADDDNEHLLLSDGFRAMRLDGPPGLFSTGPVCLCYSIEGLVTAERSLLTLRRLLALCRTGHFSRSLHRREARARRWIMMLRAHDAMAAGADQRQIAEQLFSNSVVEPGWRSRESSVRSQVQRLVRSARRLAAGNYLALLR
jgi:hypothetical protein